MYYSNVTNDEGIDFLQTRDSKFCKWFHRHLMNLRNGHYGEHELKDQSLFNVFPKLLTFKKEDLRLINELQDFFETKDYSLGEWTEEDIYNGCYTTEIVQDCTGDCVDTLYQSIETKEYFTHSGKPLMYYGISFEEKRGGRR